MTEEERKLTIALARLVLEQGAPLVFGAIKASRRETLTMEEVEDLRQRCPHPDEYLGPEN